MKVIALLVALVLLVSSVMAGTNSTEEGGEIKVFNLSDRTVLARSTILGVIYSDLAVEKNMTGYLSCEYVWYEVQFFEANTNKFLCTTGDPTDVYCGNAVVLEGNEIDGYQC